MGVRNTSAAVIAVSLLGACMASTPAPPSVDLDPVRVPPPGGDPLAPVAFLAGCWRSVAPDGGAALEERWSPPEAGTMMATSRFVRGGRVVDWEFGLVRAVDGAIEYLPYPRGVASEHVFRATEATGSEVLFEAPEHDYPKRIRYRRVDGGLEARIDGGPSDDAPRSWRMASVSCDPAGPS